MIRFVAKNSGMVKHEMVLGTLKDPKGHHEVMKKNPEMEHADANMATVAPGKSGKIIGRFTRAGKVDFAGLQPGHFDAGMKGLVNVAAKQPSTQTKASYAHYKHEPGFASFCAASFAGGSGCRCVRSTPSRNGRQQQSPDHGLEESSVRLLWRLSGASASKRL